MKLKLYPDFKRLVCLVAIIGLMNSLIIPGIATDVSAESSSAASSSVSSSSGTSSQTSSSSADKKPALKAEVKLKPIEQVISELDKNIYSEKVTYRRYMELNTSKADNKNKREILIDASDVVSLSGENFKVLNTYEGKQNIILTGQSGSVKFKFNVETDGFYNIEFNYMPMKDEKGDYQIERKMLLNGELPFFECSSVVLDRTFTSKSNKKFYDKLKNQIKPEQKEIFQWTYMKFRDRVGSSDGLYKVYLKKGENTLELISQRESAAIAQIRLFEEKDASDYSQVKNIYPSANGFYQNIQGEEADFVNDMLLQPTIDRTSSLTEPYDYFNTRYNIIGGQHFSKPGQKIEWIVKVDKAGMYNIAFRAKQSAKRDINAYADIKVDDIIPFKECENIKIQYSNDWQKLTIGNKKESFKLPLKAGENRISIELVAYKNADYVKEIEKSILRLNNCSKQILMLTGSQPDKFRDYQFKINLPEVLQVFEYEGKRLYKLAAEMKKTTGEIGNDTVTIENVAREISDMAKNPYSIAERLDNFRNNLTAMAAWLTTIKDIPVDIDSLTVFSDDKATELPQYSDNFFTKAKKEVLEFIATFFFDYQSIGGAGENKKKITVWVGTGRDQAQIIKNLSDSNFTPKHKIDVNVQLISNAMLMPSIMAGTAPDVALQQGNIVQQGSQGIMNQVGTLAVEWGLRGALYPLNNFKDYDQILNDRFVKSSYEPLGYKGKYYALPETVSFPMLFYRTDVLKDLGLSVPKTWEDVIKLIPVLQNSNMQFGLSFDFNNFNTLLMQNGGKLYNSDYSKVALDSPEAIKTFTQFTEFSTIYRLPLIYDFNNRFRTGETPIGIADFSTYNVLQVLAPEIDGLWNFCEIPGTVKENGQIDNTAALMPSSTCFITKNTKDPEAAWEYLKWWTDSEVQSLYAREIEGVLGASGRYNSANKLAFSNQLWTNDSLKLLESQMAKTQHIPQIIGGYMVVRHFDNAFRTVALSSASAVYSNGEDPRNSLLKYIDFMNQELKLKNNELKMLQFK